jgi:hypothetical protein
MKPWIRSLNIPSQFIFNGCSIFAITESVDGSRTLESTLSRQCREPGKHRCYIVASDTFSPLPARSIIKAPVKMPELYT